VVVPALTPALVILCGGKGERLGGAIKPLLRTDHGRGPAIVEVIEQAFELHVARTVLIAPAELTPALGRVSRATIVHDRGRGPGEAVLDAARAVKEPWFFVVAGDQPRPSVQLYFRMVDRIRPGTDAVAVDEAGAIFPTFTFYRREALLGITRLEGGHGISLRGVLDLLDVQTIAADTLDEGERAALLDADTPEAARALGLALTPDTNG
jgi:molybdopterin-guanine dinucleotide biosynthesis protein A